MDNKGFMSVVITFKDEQVMSFIADKIEFEQGEEEITAHEDEFRIFVPMGERTATFKNVRDIRGK